MSVRVMMAAGLVFGAAVGGCAKSEKVVEGHALVMERAGVVTMKGKPLTLEGWGGVKVGEAAPPFTAVANDMSEKSLSDWKGKVIILSTVPSLDTAVCDKETRQFNERASSLGDGVVVLTVSMDLPFAQKRWCGAAGVDRVITLSDSKRREVGQHYGLRIRENGLLARAVTVIDAGGIVRYQQIVPDVTSEPDYDAAIAAAKSAEASGKK